MSVKRAETGPMVFGGDWPGIFLRGKDAFILSQALQNIEKYLPQSLTRQVVSEFIPMLQSCILDGTVGKVETMQQASLPEGSYELRYAETLDAKGGLVKDLDEVVASNPHNVHLESLGENGACLVITMPNHKRVMINICAADVLRKEDDSSVTLSAIEE